MLKARPIKPIACAVMSAMLLFATYSHAAEPLGCIIEPERIAEVGSPVVGVVQAVLVERGDAVRKGQVLATLRAEVERASVAVASTRSQVEAEVRSAEATLKLARITQKRHEELVGKHFVSQQALDKAVADTAISEQRLALSREQLRTSQSELTLARAQLGQRTIRAPIDGIIADRYIWPGERVEEKPMFRIAKINPLRVEMVVSATLYGTITKDMSLVVIPQMPNGNALNAKVTLVDKLIDGASNTFRVRAEMPNKDSAIPSGLRCKVSLPDAYGAPGVPVVSNHLNSNDVSVQAAPIQVPITNHVANTDLANAPSANLTAAKPLAFERPLANPQLTRVLFTEPQFSTKPALAVKPDLAIKPQLPASSHLTIKPQLAQPKASKPQLFNPAPVKAMLVKFFVQSPATPTRDLTIHRIRPATINVQTLAPQQNFPQATPSLLVSNPPVVEPQLALVGNTKQTVYLALR